ncbi:MAG: hypothetical protein K2M13_02695 [Muribaculaceae bacterium]|nr:hypothetical protein [Muribaculaceae bacterium]
MSVLKYRIDKIVTKEFKVRQVNSNEKLHFSLSLQFKVNVEEKVLCCISHYEYRSESEIKMQLDLECYFQIESKYFTSLIKDNSLVIKTEILQYLATIAVGTARGEIHARSAIAESPLQNTVLPPVDLTNIIKSPAEFKV